MMNIFKSGSKQWMFQRLSNACIVAYSLLLVCLLFTVDLSSFTSVSNLFQSTWFKVITSLCVVFFAFNSVLAGWQIAGDYVKQKPLNKLFNMICMIASAVSVVIILATLWG